TLNHVRTISPTVTPSRFPYTTLFRSGDRLTEGVHRRGLHPIPHLARVRHPESRRLIIAGVHRPPVRDRIGQHAPGQEGDRAWRTRAPHRCVLEAVSVSCHLHMLRPTRVPAGA